MTNSEAKDTLKMMVGLMNMIAITSIDTESNKLFTQICLKYSEAAEIACLALDDQIELEKKENGGTT